MGDDAVPVVDIPTPTSAVGEFPITRVVLFKHGIGYFCRMGLIEGDSTFPLYFHVDVMNDVLKSLSVFDVTGGVISSVSYENTKPVEVLMKERAFAFNENSSFLDLLAQLKGADVVVERKGDRSKASGVLLGIEERKFEDSRNKPYQVYLVNLLENARVTTIPMQQIESLTVLGDSLRADIVHLLGVLLQSKKKDTKSLTVYAQGEGLRHVLASYVVEAPVWKTTYRLILTTKEGESVSQSLMQGWAIVDNTTPDDWDNVDLALMSGSANSFIHDLYQPRYRKRTEIEVEEEEAVAPPVLDDDVETIDSSELSTAKAVSSAPSAAPSAPKRARKKQMPSASRDRAAPQLKPSAPMRRSAAAGPPPPMPMASMSMAPPPMMAPSMAMNESAALSLDAFASSAIDYLGGGDDSDEEAEMLSDLLASVSAQPEMGIKTDGGESLTANIGGLSGSLAVDTETKKIDATDMFQYDIANKVVVKRNESALVPFLSSKFECKRMAVYNPAVRADCPLSVVYFTNTFGISLEGGPMTLYEDSVYVGEAMFATSHPGDDIYIPFAVELKCSVTIEESSEMREPYNFNVYKGGSISASRYEVVSTTYVLKNRRKRDLDIVIEHRKKTGHLVETKAPIKNSSNFWRFSVCAPGDDVCKFVVKERRSTGALTWNLSESLERSTVEMWADKEYITGEQSEPYHTLIDWSEEKALRTKHRDRFYRNHSELTSDLGQITAAYQPLNNMGAEDGAVEIVKGIQEDFNRKVNEAWTAYTEERDAVNALENKIREFIRDHELLRSLSSDETNPKLVDMPKTELDPFGRPVGKHNRDKAKGASEESEDEPAAGVGSG